MLGRDKPTRMGTMRGYKNRNGENNSAYSAGIPLCSEGTLLFEEIEV
jgi:hypothetical protein